MRKKLLLLLSALPLLAQAVETANVTIANRSPKGIGYNHGYSSLDYFYLAQPNLSILPYFDLRAHVFNNGKPAFNMGTGFRFMGDSCSLTAGGFNLFWDYGEGRHTTFHQLGAGIEFLWPRWDLHANGYVPVNKHKQKYREGFSKFEGNRARVYRKYETAMSGVDLTLGYSFPYYDCYSFRIFLTGYYFKGDFDQKAGGACLKLRTDLWNCLSLEGAFSYDTEFKWIPQGEIALRFPFGPCFTASCQREACCGEKLLFEQKMTQKPERFEIIVTTTKKVKNYAKDPNTKEDLNFIFVDNNFGSSGTFEDPFASIEEAFAASNAGDLIYIFPGKETYFSTADLPLKERQRLIGSAAPVIVRGNTIPPQTKGRPLLNLNANQIILASDNQIEGLFIEGSGSAIRNPSTGHIRNATIQNNLFAMGANGVSITEDIGTNRSFSGKLKILNNVFFATEATSKLAELEFDFPDSAHSAHIGFNTFAPLSGSPTSGFLLVNGPDNQTEQAFFENNVILTTGNFGVAADLSTGPSLPENTPVGSLLIRNNQVTAQGADALFAIRVGAYNGLQFVYGNQTFSAGNAAMAFITPSTQNNNMKWWKNSAESGNPANADFLYQTTTNPAILLLQSPNLEQSGVDLINSGSSVIINGAGGSVEYIPFE